MRETVERTWAGGKLTREEHYLDGQRNDSPDGAAAFRIWADSKLVFSAKYINGVWQNPDQMEDVEARRKADEKEDR